MLSAWLAGISCAPYPQAVDDKTDTRLEPVPIYGFEVLNTYPHDREAFTQGLACENGVLFEGTGRNGESTLRKVDPKTGRVLQVRSLPDKYFGEGITIFRDTIIQLTWRSGKGFVYDKHSFEILSEFSYTTEGWGITHDEKRLIMSDGTSTLYLLDPSTFENIDHIQVRDDDTPVNNLNELEFINGQVYANVWHSDNIVMIDPLNGRVTGWIDLEGILPPQANHKPEAALNGIAHDPFNNRLFVTGKLWPQLFEIKLETKR